MPEPQPIETDWTFEQAHAFVRHRDVAKARNPPPFNRSPGAFEALWALIRALELRAVPSSEHGQPVDPLQWGDRQRHLRQHEKLVKLIGLGQFIAELRKATRHTLIPVAELLAAFPVVEVSPALPVEKKKKPPPREPITVDGASRKPALVDEVAAKLLQLYPEGRGPLDMYPALLETLKKAGVPTSDATLKRAIAKIKKTGADWR
jgi:hypothetical protein